MPMGQMIVDNSPAGKTNAYLNNLDSFGYSSDRTTFNRSSANNSAG